MAKLFESSNFIKAYLPTDKYIQIIYPNGDRFYNLNVCQRKKVVLDKNILEIWSEGNLAKQMTFSSEAEARLGFDALNQALDLLYPNCVNEITNPPAAVFSVIPVTYSTYKTLQSTNSLLELQFYDVTDTTNQLGVGIGFIYRLLAKKTDDYYPSGFCINTRANVTINTIDNTFALYQFGNATSINQSGCTGINSGYLFAVNNSVINATDSNYIEAYNNSQIDCLNCQVIKVSEGTQIQTQNCDNCEFKGLQPVASINGYSQVYIDTKTSIGKGETETNSGSGTLTLYAYKNGLNQVFDAIVGAYTAVNLATEFPQANATFKVSFGTIAYNIVFKDLDSGATLLTATPTLSGKTAEFVWDKNLLTYVYVPTDPELIKRVNLTVTSDGQTIFPTVLIPAPLDPNTVKMYINNSPSLDFSISGSTTIIYNESEYSLETDDAVYVEYI